MTQLSYLSVSGRRLGACSKKLELTWAPVQFYSNRLTKIPSAIGQMKQLTRLYVRQFPKCFPNADSLRRAQLQDNRITHVPAELGQLRALMQLWLSDNQIETLPAELGDLQSLTDLDVRKNKLAWLPAELQLLPKSTEVFVSGNPLPAPWGVEEGDARAHLKHVSALTTRLATMRDRAAEICIALQDLGLPALVTLKIINKALPNRVRMAAKWDLVVAVKHFHDERPAAAISP